MRCRHSMPRSDGHPTRATWGARCGKSARRVLRGGTGTSDLVARPVPTHHRMKGSGNRMQVSTMTSIFALYHRVQAPQSDAPIHSCDSTLQKALSTDHADPYAESHVHFAV